MLAPKKTKHRKWQNGRKSEERLQAPSTRGTTVSFGSYGLKAVTGTRITSNQIEAARRVIARTSGKAGQIWIRIFPDRPFTQKAAGVRMGSGKGDVQGYVADVRPGRILFELDGVTEAVAREAVRKAGTKLPIKVRFATRN